jgi:hypothetical protein
VLVLRAWTEPGAPQLRARLVEPVALSTGGSSGSTVAGVSEICDAVRSWLEALAAAGDARVTAR